MSKRQNLMIAGGGTGGHVLAGIAIADAWVRQSNAQSVDQPLVEFVGAQGGIEERLVPKAGYPLRLLRLGSLNRVTSGRKLKTLIQLPFAFWSSIRILRRAKPDFVLGVGGYASGPVVLMAKFLRMFRLLDCQISILEQNSIPGFTNRLLGRWADMIFAAFPGTEKRFPRKRVILTGNPVRSSMKTLPSAVRRPFTIFVFGGSQGAVGMNTLVIESLPFLTTVADQIRWIHQTGEKDFERVQQAYQKYGISARVEKFVDRMVDAYGEASLLVCRAGSSTLFEVAAVGRAALFVPLPTAADRHQEINARVFSDAGAGFLVLQTSTTGKEFAARVQSLIQNDEELRRVERAVQQFAMPNAADQVAEWLRKSRISG
jgi:UDP-N-acetylglucosamine--N-acetylmuramyl-(pentapeptide) pyrophosphoryl-undecaprenol N-acetylglucosamine transferase